MDGEAELRDLKGSDRGGGGVWLACGWRRSFPAPPPPHHHLSPLFLLVLSLRGRSGGPATNQNKSKTKDLICEEEEGRRGALESGWGGVGWLVEGGVSGSASRGKHTHTHSGRVPVSHAEC